MTVTVRSVVPGEGGLVRDFLWELAVYEKLDGDFRVTAEQLEALLFGPNPRVFCDVAELDGEPAGIALWHYSFPSFTGKLAIWLEDLVIREAHRGQGLGVALIARLAARAVEEGLYGVAWNALDWNEPAIRVYDGLGARQHSDWVGYWLEGDALADVAARAV